MGFKSWRSLSVLLLAGAALVGCNNTPQKDNRPLRLPAQTPGPVGQAQASQTPAPFPGAPPAAANQQGTQLTNQQKPVVPPFSQTTGQVPNGASLQPQAPLPQPSFPIPQPNSSGIAPTSNIAPPSLNQGSGFGTSRVTTPQEAGPALPAPPAGFR